MVTFATSKNNKDEKFLIFGGYEIDPNSTISWYPFTLIKDQSTQFKTRTFEASGVGFKDKN